MLPKWCSTPTQLLNTGAHTHLLPGRVAQEGLHFLPGQEDRRGLQTLKQQQARRQGRRHLPDVTPIHSSPHCARRWVQQNTVWCAVRASNVLASPTPGLP